MNTRCAEQGCDRDRKTRGYCQRHYQWHRRQGHLPAKPHIVADKVGVVCFCCGRLLRDHGLTEFCQLEQRRAM